MASPFRRVHGLAVWGLTLSLLAGCGSGSDIKTVPVSGTVTYNGDPLTIGSVLFIPEGGGSPAQANIDSSGSFTMGTVTETDGAIPGTHRVMVNAITQPGGSGLAEDSIKRRGDAAPVSVIPTIYGDSSKSPLKVELKNGKNILEIVLTTKSGEVKHK